MLLDLETEFLRGGCDPDVDAVYESRVGKSCLIERCYSSTGVKRLRLAES